MKKIFIFTITMTINNFIFCQIWEENAYAENENSTFFDVALGRPKIYKNRPWSAQGPPRGLRRFA